MNQHPTPTPTRTRSVASRIMVAVVALLATLVAFSPTVSAAPASVTYLNLGPGFNDIYNGQDTGSYLFEVDGQPVTAYCADVTLAFNGGANFTLVPVGTSGLVGVAEAGWLAANASDVATPAADADTEASAIQVAIWSYTNAITIDATTVPYEPVRTRATALVAAAAGQSMPSGPTTFALTLTGAVDGLNAVFTAIATDDAGTPLEGQVVSFTAGDLTGDVTTNAAGAASWSVPAAGAGVGVTAAAAMTGTILAGSVLVPDDASQPLVIANNINVSRTAEATATTGEAAPPVAQTPPAPPAGTPPAGTPPAEELPYTGGTLGLPHLLAGIAVLGGSTFAVRRMRNSAVAG